MLGKADVAVCSLPLGGLGDDGRGTSADVSEKRTGALFGGGEEDRFKPTAHFDDCFVFGDGRAAKA